MPDALKKTADINQPATYQIRLEGQLSSQWENWFEGMQVTLQDNGDTLLTGPVTDQAALYSLLKKIRNLGMPLLAVQRVESSDINT
jgi:hypothetical protein